MAVRHRQLIVRAACAATAAALLAACTSSGGDGTAGGRGDAAGPPVVAPGRPGEDNTTLSPEQAAKARPDDRPNSADIAYMRMMPVHHRQALVMTGLAAEHAEDSRVRRIAARIAAAQKPEIEAMEAWLETNAPDDGDEGHDKHGGHGGHGGADMPGMATEEQLQKLRAARGEKFDELFLKLMIAHHQGAVTMATDVTSDGNDPYIEETATDVIASQSAEISRMRAML
ncbi:DUF305 domain-containing protein [Streptomyces sp. NPDC059506]|uniref:DUF305 domain-containing protein n=1 Tax=Streptomyces sp. NPDC059506 TaxID=3347751 RepID=UPI0036B5A04A